LESSGKGVFGELRVWEGASSGEGELRMMRRTELVRKRERESDLNVVGPKMVETSSTGQTGCSDRSDRSGPG